MGSGHIATYRSPTVSQSRVVIPNRYLKVVGGVRQSWCSLAVISAPPHESIVREWVTCADTSKVDQVVDWRVGIAPQHFLSSYRSYQEQTCLANILRAATQHQSSGVGEHGDGRSDVLPQGESISQDYCMSQQEDQSLDHNLLSEIYQTAKCEVKAAMFALEDDLSLNRSDVEKAISVGLQQAGLLRDHIAHTITEDMCEPMLQSLQRAVIPRLDRTLQEVATPTHDALASTWQHFLETYEDIIDLASKSTSVKDIKKEVLTPLSGLGPHGAKMWRCLDRLDLSSEGRSWLQETWGVHSGTWRPLVLKAQNAVYKVVDTCAVMFWRSVSRYLSFSFDSSQLTAVLCRVKERVVKRLETDLLALRSRLIVETILQITLAAFTCGVGEQDLSHYYALVNSGHALFIHPDTIFHSIVRDNPTSYIQSVLQHSLPQQFMPLPVSPSNPCSSSSCFSEPVYHEPLPPRDHRCHQNFCQTSDDPTSGSEALTPSTVSDRDDTLGNSENHTSSLLDAGEYIRLTQP